MTEYELADLFVDTVSGAGNIFMALVTIMTGFLIIGIYFGQLLDRAMTAILVAGYSIVFAITTLQVNRAYTTFSSLSLEIKERAADGGEFQWHSAAHSPEWISTMGPFIATGLLVLGYVGSLIFFFRTRMLDPKDFR